MSNSVDPERVQKLVSSMRESVRLLRELAELSQDKFMDDRHKQSSAKYNFVTAIEAAIDIANHVISRKGFRAPDNYADTFKVLAEEGCVEKSFGAELQKMARFRNRLVHLYWNVDNAEIWRILQFHLDDFDEYLQSLKSILKTQ